MTFDDLLKQMVQTQRKQPPAVLYGGNLQDNTTLSFTEQKYEETPVSNKAKSGNSFANYGSAITDRDDRMFMAPQPQVPANPELEALNDYFNQRRLDQFAQSSSAMVVGETIQKQAEQTASMIVKDEMDRRAGIRRAVLERTGLTPSQIQQQLVAESVAGVNPRALDMRDQQIQDAVNLYYNINNIPAPVTTPMTNPVPSTTPSGTIPETPAPETPAPETPAPETPAPATEEDQAEPEDNLIRAPEELSPEEPGPFPSEILINTATAKELARYIVEFNIRDPLTVEGRGPREGEMKKESTIAGKTKSKLLEVVLNELYRRQGRAGVNRPARGSLMQEPSAVPKTDGLGDEW
jgi:hypothetical protein